MPINMQLKINIDFLVMVMRCSLLTWIQTENDLRLKLNDTDCALTLMKNTVDLVVAGLFDSTVRLESQELTSIDELLKWLSRAIPSKSEPDVYRLVAGMLNLPFGEQIPLAALYDFYCTDQRASWVLFIDPVNLKADRDKLYMFGSGNLNLTQSDANSLTAAIQTIYRQEGWQIQAMTPHRWCLRLGEDPKANFVSLTTVLGRSIEEFMPSGETGKKWRSILNEIQMLLYDQVINLERETEGKLTVNSVWFWGGGSVAGIPVSAAQKGLQGIWTDDAIVGGMARLAKVADYDLPVDGEMFLSKFESGFTSNSAPDGYQNHLIYIDIATTNSMGSEIGNGAQAIQQLNNLWIKPLMQGLQQDKIEVLRLFDGTGRCFILTRKALRRWWRRRLPITHYL